MHFLPDKKDPFLVHTTLSKSVCYSTKCVKKSFEEIFPLLYICYFTSIFLPVKLFYISDNLHKVRMGGEQVYHGIMTLVQNKELWRKDAKEEEVGAALTEVYRTEDPWCLARLLRTGKTDQETENNDEIENV